MILRSHNVFGYRINLNAAENNSHQENERRYQLNNVNAFKQSSQAEGKPKRNILIERWYLWIY